MSFYLPACPCGIIDKTAKIRKAGVSLLKKSVVLLIILLFLCGLLPACGTDGGIGSDSGSASDTADISSSGSESSSSSSTEQSSSSSQQSSSSGSSTSTATPADGSWNLILVNSKYLLPDNFTVSLAYIGAYRVDERIKEPLQDMIAAAKADGVELMLSSAYRTKEKSAELYAAQVEKWKKTGLSQAEAEAEAAKWVAPPGTSEHHTGLAVDLVTPTHQVMDHAFADTEAAKWMKAHCAEYGFILRYPEDKQDITGITFEPWHFRYVGVKDAKAIMSAGLCLEEYLGKY